MNEEEEKDSRVAQALNDIAEMANLLNADDPQGQERWDHLSVAAKEATIVSILFMGMNQTPLTTLLEAEAISRGMRVSTSSRELLAAEYLRFTADLMEQAGGETRGKESIARFFEERRRR